jgi:hypothetical protein
MGGHPSIRGFRRTSLASSQHHGPAIAITRPNKKPNFNVRYYFLSACPKLIHPFHGIFDGILRPRLFKQTFSERKWADGWIVLTYKETRRGDVTHSTRSIPDNTKEPTTELRTTLKAENHELTECKRRHC